MNRYLKIIILNDTLKMEIQMDPNFHKNIIKNKTNVKTKILGGKIIMWL